MKKILSLLALILCFSILFTACGKGTGNKNNPSSSSGEGTSKNTSDENNASANPNTYAEVKFTALPTDTGLTLSLDEALEKYRPYTDWRIYSIRTTKTEVTPKDGGKAYYVSNNGDDSNDGTSPEKAIKSIANIGKLPLKAGDVVYFERGGVWRGSLKANVAGVTYSAYGEGRKPELYASPENAANKDCWEATDAENIWVYHNATGLDVGTIVFNQGEELGIKAVVEQNGSQSRNATTRKDFSSYKDLDKNYHFYHAKNGKVYLYYDKGNPGENFDSIELSVKQHIISVKADNVTIDNLCLKYGGAHGISSGSTDGLTVTNCEFGFIGGSIQTGTTRYGNGVEIWGQALNYTVENCYFYQMYDTGATFQYSTQTADDSTKAVNVKFNNNVFEYCNYSMEYFLTAGDASISYIENFEIKGNLAWFAGEGLCSQRPTKTGNTHIKSWGHKNNIKGNFVISDNLFAIAADMLVETISKSGTAATYDNNIYMQTDRKKIGSNGQYNNAEKFTAENVEKVTGDKNAKIITVTSK